MGSREDFERACSPRVCFAIGRFATSKAFGAHEIFWIDIVLGTSRTFVFVVFHPFGRSDERETGFLRALSRVISSAVESGRERAREESIHLAFSRVASSERVFRKSALRQCRFVALEALGVHEVF